MFILNLFILLYFWKLIQFIVFYAVCSGLTASPPQSPFQCLDLVYISVLLQELGFPPTKQFKVRNTRVQDLGQSLGQSPGSGPESGPETRIWARVQDLGQRPGSGPETRIKGQSLGQSPGSDVLCLCVAAGEDDQRGGDQLGSGSNVSLHRVPEETLMLLL